MILLVAGAVVLFSTIYPSNLSDAMDIHTINNKPHRYEYVLKLTAGGGTNAAMQAGKSKRTDSESKHAGSPAEGPAERQVETKISVARAYTYVWDR
eukprot:6213274-Pleurochrysis_carterae.AAC.2